MAGYIIATVRILDRVAFAEYVNGVAGLSEEYGGEPIFKGGVLEVLEGDSAPDERLVVTRFPDIAKARAYVSDPRYQDAKRLREGAAIVQIRLCED